MNASPNMKVQNKIRNARFRYLRKIIVRRYLLIPAIFFLSCHLIAGNIEKRSHGISLENPTLEIPTAKAEEVSQKIESVEDKVRQVFHEYPEVALAIFRGESGLNPGKESDSDRMADGRPFSIGLTQINITVSRIGDTDCTKAFRGKNYKAVVVDEGLYEKCVSLAKDPNINLQAARQKYERHKFSPWTVYTSGAYAKFL